MNKKILLMAGAVFLAAAAGGLFYYFNYLKPSHDLESSGGFNFMYDSGGSYKVDTFSGKLTKVMVMDPAVTIDFRFSDEEIASIKQKIAELKLLQQDPKAVLYDNSVKTPCFSDYLKIQAGNAVYEKKWDDCTGIISDSYL
ncbi:MAG: hypothetical protein MUD10_01485, partial [Candidatus Pacebacteria bacterium]|nr:hypothetical protein [Candidatus Paceibacterota bacterium]